MHLASEGITAREGHWSSLKRSLLFPFLAVVRKEGKKLKMNSTEPTLQSWRQGTKLSLKYHRQEKCPQLDDIKAKTQKPPERASRRRDKACVPASWRPAHNQAPHADPVDGAGVTVQRRRPAGQPAYSESSRS